MKPARTLWLWPVVTGAVLLVGWYALRHLVGVGEWLLPTPDEILQAAWRERGRLLPAAGNTALGALCGFTLAAVTGFLLALLVGGFRSLRASLYPWLMVLQMTPVVVLTPLIVLWAGSGLPGIVTVTFLISFFPIVVNMTQGLRSVDANLVDLFRMSNATPLQELWLLRVPAAMPYYLAGLRIAATLAPIGAIFGEYLVGNSAGGAGGLGFLVYSYNTQIKIPALFATALASCLLGFVFVAAVAWLNWAVLHRWHDSFEHKDR